MADISSNTNKYYSMELHVAKEGGDMSYFRIFTHYGRTDDLGRESEGTGAAQDEVFEHRQCRYLNSLQQANVSMHWVANKTHSAS